MFKQTINDYNYTQFSKYYFRIVIDDEEFFVKMQGNYRGLKNVILYKNTIYYGPEIQCTGDYCSNKIAQFLNRFDNTIEEDYEKCKAGDRIFTLYTYQEIKYEKNIIKDKIFNFYDFERNLNAITKENFIEICFKDREKKDRTKYYLQEEDFVERISEDEIVVDIRGNKYIKTVYKDSKGEEYIKGGALSSAAKLYLTERQGYLINKATQILKEHKEVFEVLGEGV